MHVDDLRPRYFESGEEGPSERPCFVPSSIPDPGSEALPTSPPSPSGSCVFQVCYRTAGATRRFSSLGTTKLKST
ncbi:hypothetical protein MRX96_043778 [Rhipicephalus microplus]